jgi:AcrR family transcriptional regulator
VTSVGLRERKKLATRERLMRMAVDLFEERGFDHVSVAEIADAADVSKMTVYNYFPVKEDLVTGVAEHHIDEPATVVRERAPGQTPHAAMLDFFLASLAERQPYTGLSDDPEVLRLHRLVVGTPALTVRMLHYQHESERLLADALVEQEASSELTARLIAAQILGTQQALVRENHRRILAGEAADDIYPDAVRNAKHAYRILETGLGHMFRRKRH